MIPRTMFANLKGWFKAKDPAVKAAVVAGICAIVASAVTGLFLVVSTTHNTPSPVAPHGSSAPLTAVPTSASSSSCAKKLRITSPKDGEAVSGPDGIGISGEACGLTGEYGWVFDHDSGDGYYHEDYLHNPGPVVTSNGHWRFLHKPVGGKDDRNAPYTITLVLASPECNQALLAISPTDKDYKLKSFPAGCDIQDTADIAVTWKR